MLIGPGPLSELAPHPGVTGLAVGVFDGVHLGHQAVVKSLRGNIAALTFEPHPLAVISPPNAPPRLTTLEQKMELLCALGTVAVIAVKFDAALRHLSPGAFVAEIVRIFPDLRQIAIGENWSFGRDRAGNATALAELARPHRIEVLAIAPVLMDGSPVSSTRIREAILQRQFPLAEKLLGRAYAVTGRVIHGQARGRTIGFPTANLGDVEQLLPPRGVYAVKARADHSTQTYTAVMNLGQRPTFTSNGTDSLEAHLLDFTGDLYGHELELSGFAWLRDEKTFPDAETLKAQIARDVDAARKI